MDIPAFPTHGQAEGDDPRNQILSGGMTLRDYFAAAALQGLIAYSGNSSAYSDLQAKQSYKIADAMMAERSKRGATAFQQENSDG